MTNMINLEYNYGYSKENLIEKIEAINVSSISIEDLMIGLIIVFAGVMIMGFMSEAPPIGFVGLLLLIAPAYVLFLESVEVTEDAFEIEKSRVNELVKVLDDNKHKKVIFLKNEKVKNDVYIHNYLYTTPSRVRINNFEGLGNEDKKNIETTKNITKNKEGINKLNKKEVENVVVVENVNDYEKNELYQAVIVTNNHKEELLLIEKTGTGKILKPNNFSKFTINYEYKVLDKGDKNIVFEKQKNNK